MSQAGHSTLIFQNHQQCSSIFFGFAQDFAGGLRRPHRDNNFGAQGALGNALLFNSIVILDLGAHPRFGIISSKESD
jgi:hypothetical protein